MDRELNVTAPSKRHGVEKHSIAALVHGEYLVRPALDSGDRDSEGVLLKSSPLLLGFHGYGETAHEHLAELQTIPGQEGWTLCAVQALHPFYKRSTGDVVRSWMTKEQRDLAIDDNIRYVGSVVAEVRRRYRADGPLVISGFSQGVAMAWRAAAGCGFPCAGLLVLAGDVPSEVPERMPGRPVKVLLGRGSEDAWYSEAKMDQDLRTLESMGADVEPCVFEAGHVWHDDYRRAAGALLGSIGSEG